VDRDADGAGTRIAELAPRLELEEPDGSCSFLAAGDLDGGGVDDDVVVGCPVSDADGVPHGRVGLFFDPAPRGVARPDATVSHQINDGHSQLGVPVVVVPGPSPSQLYLADGGYSRAWLLDPPRRDLDLWDQPPTVACANTTPNDEDWTPGCAATFGTNVDVVHPDLTGDGVADLFAFAPEGGAAWWARLDADLDPTRPDASYRRLRDPGGLVVTAAGDLDGDGVDELVATPGFSDDPRCYLFRVRPGEHLVEDEAFATLVPESDTDGGCTGGAVQGVGDLDGDGNGELLVGAPSWGDARQGRVYLFYGPLVGERRLADADAIFTGPEPLGQVGMRVYPAGDLDGDGGVELVIGAPGGLTDLPGHVFVYRGAPRGALDPADAAVVWVGAPGDAFGAAAVATDRDGDGDTELWVAAPNADVGGRPGDLVVPGAGKVYLLDLE
jgi:hypothetical protein